MFKKINVTTIFIAVSFVFQLQFVPCASGEIVPGDVLEITVYEHKDLSVVTRVSSEGYISIPLLGELHVGGMDVRALEEKIVELLDKDYIVNPDVVVFTKEYRTGIVHVMGEVVKSQAVELTRNKVTTVLEAISIAGGFTDLANKNNIIVIRRKADGTEKEIIVNLSSIIKGKKKSKGGGGNVSLEPGDIIVVSEGIF